MGTHRLRPGEIKVGTPLPYDAYDADGRLLLRRGAVVTSEVQAERLIEQGLFSDAPPRESAAVLVGTASRSVERERVSVFQRLDDLRSRVAALLTPGVPADLFSAGVLAAAAEIQGACDLDLDAAVASVLLSRWMPYSARHCCNCAVLCEALGRQLEWPVEQRLSLLAAALTMNVAMMELQDTFYRQKEPLDDTQKDLLRAHPAAGRALLQDLGVSDAVWLACVEQHHEALDGSGYPQGVSGDALLREARVLAVADKYCAMVSERAYRDGAPADAALRQMLMSHGKGLDTELAARLVREVGLYPPGSAVELNNGEVGVVVKRTLDARHPVVRVVISSQGRPLPECPKRLTSKAPFGVKGAVSRARLGADFHPVPLWNPTLVERDE